MLGWVAALKGRVDGDLAEVAATVHDGVDAALDKIAAPVRVKVSAVSLDGVVVATAQDGVITAEVAVLDEVGLLLPKECDGVRMELMMSEDGKNFNEFYPEKN